LIGSTSTQIGLCITAAFWNYMVIISDPLAKFRLPVLPSGDYSISVTIAEGTQEEHQQLHWISDAVLFKSESSSARSGLIGIPMLKVNLQTL
jgi:hypothetical protein